MELDLHVTNRCNLKCRHCVYKSGDREMPDFPYTTLKSLICDFRKLNIEEIHITGGEPLLHPDIYSMIQFLSTNGFIVKMQSNGLLIDQVSAEKLVQAGLQQILISLDGLREYHNHFRCSERAFQGAIDAIKCCLAAHIPVRVNTVVSKENSLEVADLIYYLKEFNISQHSFFYLTPIGRGETLKVTVLSFEEWKATQDVILKAARKFKLLERIKVQDVFHKEKQFIKSSLCRNDNCLILSNGDVYHCVFFTGSSDYKLGNIFNSQLVDIWGELPKVLTHIFKKRCTVNSCSDDDCVGGCPGMTYLLEGRVDVCDPRCNPRLSLYSSCIRRYNEIIEEA